MAMMLRTVHGHFGDRPKIGKFFQVRGSHSLATFFSVTAKKQDGERITGLVIVSMPSGMKPAAAVLFDRADRFGTTEPLLMKKLSEAWKSQETSPEPDPEPAAAPARGGAIQPLQVTTFPDRSGHVGLPAGWRIIQAGGGTVHAAGPQGESIHFGVILRGIYNPGNPKSREMLSYLNKTHKPYFLCRSSADLVGAYQAISQQNHQRMGTPVPSLKVVSLTRLQPNQYEVQAVLVRAEIDNHDGKGPLRSSLRLGATREDMSGAWSMYISGAMVPDRLADEEWPTMTAMYASYGQDAAVINGQTAVVIAGIHQVTANSLKQSADANAANDRRNQAFDAAHEGGSKHNQSEDGAKYNKSFENYQLDQTVVQDNESSARGTLGYASADSLVKNNPNRYQYVPTQDLHY
jgi:hypothetical protein